MLFVCFVDRFRRNKCEVELELDLVVGAGYWTGQYLHLDTEEQELGEICGE